MARDVLGNYTLPAGNPVISGTTITAGWANSTLADIALALTGSLSRSGQGGMTAPLRGIDGNAAAPAFAFTTEAGLGLFRAAAGALGFGSGGAEQMRLNADGGLGLGAVAPAATLFRIGRNPSGGSTALGVTVDGVIQSGVTAAYSGFDSNVGTQAAVFTLPQLNHFRARFVGAGAGSTVTVQNGFLVDSSMVGAGANYGFRGALVASAFTRWNCYMDGSAPNHFSGPILHGGTTVRDGCHLTCVAPGAASAAGFYITGDNSVNRDVVWIGTTVNGASGAIRLNGFTISLVNVSDHRRKENIRAVVDAETRLAKLQPVEFDWKGHDLPRQRGFLAHEFAEVYPQAVSGEKDAVGEDGQPAYQMMSDAVVIPDLVAAVKHLLSRVEDLERAV